MTCRSFAALAASMCAVACTLLPRPAHAWGGLGHQYVTRLAIASLPDSPLKRFLARNETWLATSASHPDRWRNRPDAAENARHFLDTENFGFGSDLSKVPHDFAGVEKLRTYEQLRTDGTNPWTVKRIYSLLVIALREKRFDDAMVQAAYLSHYLGDAHVPFHASANYDGQLSTPAQRGIHARFEERVLERSIRFEDLHAGSPLAFNDPVNATFDALQASINDVPAILAADRTGFAIAGNVTDEAYWGPFVAKSRPIAVARLETAGRLLAGAYLAAWTEAGRPALPDVYTANDRALPYAPPFVPRGAPFQPAQPTVTADEKARARSNSTQIVAAHFPSRALGKIVPGTVLLPRDYFTSNLRYPVLYLLHGATGNYNDWLQKSGVAAYVADLPVIVVLPDSQGDSWYQDSPKFGKWQTFFFDELMPAIEREYRTINRRDGRAMAGLSMGGYGAWRLALEKPERFISTASLSGALGWGGDTSDALKRYAANLFGDSPELTKMLTAGALWPRLEKRMGRGGVYNGPALYFDIGKDDFLNASNRDMERRLLEKGVPYEFAEFNGAHTWEYWDEHIRDALNFTMRHLAAPKCVKTEGTPRAMRLAGFGLINLDQVAVVESWERDHKFEATQFFEQVGGPVPVALCAFARLGGSADFFGTVGDDAAGILLGDSLRDQGVAASLTRVANTPTSRSLVFLDSRDGSRTLANHAPPLPSRTLSPDEEARLCLAGAVHLDGRDLEASLRIASLARGAGALVSLDLGTMRPGRQALIAVSDIVIASRKGGAGAFPQFADDPLAQVSQFLDGGARVAGVTLAERGVVIGATEMAPTLLAPHTPERVVDTCGAGDTFHGAFLWAYLGGANAVDAAEFAQAAVALRIAHYGNEAGLPTKNLVEARLARKKS